MSLFFGFLSQTLLSSMGIFFAMIGIACFVFISVIFDMIGIASTSCDKKVIERWTKENIKGSKIALKLSQNSEKVCSFCADVVGDICSTLCGAGGACIVVTLSKVWQGENLIMVLSIVVSALIAGVTIFCKALMKAKAINNANEIILKVGILLEKMIRKRKKKKKL